MNRFVILHHCEKTGEHWDLMLEREGVLLTWRLLAEPRSRDALPIEAQRIADHRLAYLDYEGPLTRDRGTVRRVDSGQVLSLQQREDRCTFVLHGDRVRGEFQLVRVRDHWMLEPASVEDPPPP